MKKRIFFNLVLLFTLVIGALVLTLGIAVTHAWTGSLRRQIETDVRRSTAMFASQVAAAPLSGANLQQATQSFAQVSGTQATVIDSQGRVLADSSGDSDETEDQLRRPEFQAALAGRVGSDTRSSNTAGVDLLYVAQPVPGGAVRLALPLTAIAEATHRLWHLLGIAFLAGLVHRGRALRRSLQKHQHAPGAHGRLRR